MPPPPPAPSADATAAPPRPGRSGLHVLKLLGPVARPYRPRVIGALVALSAAAGLVLALGRGLRAVIDRGFAAGDPHWLNLTLLFMLLATAALACATYARFYLVSWLGERITADLRRHVFRHLLQLDVAYFETTRTGDIVSRLTVDLTLLQQMIGSSASMALRNALLLAGGMALLFMTSAKLTLIVLVATPLVLVPIIAYARRTRHLTRTSQDRVADVAAEISETLDALRTIRAFNGEDLAAGQFETRVEGAFAAARRRVQSRAALTAVVIFLVFGAVALILWVGGHDVLAGTLSGGQLGAFVFYAIIVASGAGAISEVLADLERAAGAAERVFELLDEVPQVQAPLLPLALPPRGQGSAVVFDAVNFAYPGMPDRPVLHDLSFTIQPGQRVAIVGPSGAGKSTIFQLLLRFYDPTAGTVQLDGVDLRLAAPAALRDRMALVAQEPTLFSASAFDNIRFGRPAATSADVRTAASAANALDFIDRLPDGFDTHLGEKGVRLSGGQRQRLAIARAILRDPALLLLDEATSALDAESERLVQEALERVMPVGGNGRTTLIIAHRLATVRSADRILVLDGGRLVGDGTHDSLSREGGLYARLAALQFRPET